MVAKFLVTIVAKEGEGTAAMPELQIRWIAIPHEVVISGPDSPHVRLLVAVTPYVPANESGSPRLGAGVFTNWPETANAELLNEQDQRKNGFRVEFAAHTDNDGNLIHDTSYASTTGRIVDLRLNPEDWTRAWAAAMFPVCSDSVGRNMSTRPDPQFAPSFLSYPHRTVANQLKSYAARQSIRNIAGPHVLTPMFDFKTFKNNGDSTPYAFDNKELFLVEDFVVLLPELDISGLLWSSAGPVNEIALANELGRSIPIWNLIAFQKMAEPESEFRREARQWLDIQGADLRAWLRIVNGNDTVTKGDIDSGYEGNASLRTVRLLYRIDRSADPAANPDTNLHIKTVLNIIGSLPYRVANTDRSSIPLPNTVDFIHVLAFHGRASNPVHPVPRSEQSLNDPPIEPGKSVLNQFALAQNYPSLLRRLGLILELRVAIDPAVLADKCGPNGVGVVKVTPNSDVLEPATRSNPTATRFRIGHDNNKWIFQADDGLDSNGAPRESKLSIVSNGRVWRGFSSVRSGYIALNRAIRQEKPADALLEDSQKFHLEILDIDKAALKLRNFGRTGAEQAKATIITVSESLDASTDDLVVHYSDIAGETLLARLTALTDPATVKKKGLRQFLDDDQVERIAKLFASCAKPPELGFGRRILRQVRLNGQGDRSDLFADVEAIQTANRTGLVWSFSPTVIVDDSANRDQPPGFDSGGIALIWSSRDKDLAETVSRDLSARLDSSRGRTTILYAADLVLGFVPFVRIVGPESRKSRRWVSLCGRSEDYTNIDPALGVEYDAQAPIRMAASRAQDQAATKPSDKTGAPASVGEIEEHLIGEPLFRWHGGSLATSQSHDDVTLEDHQYQGVGPPPEQPISVVAHPSQRLRFSWPYIHSSGVSSTRRPAEYSRIHEIDRKKYDVLQYRFCVSVMDRTGQYPDPNEEEIGGKVDALETPYLRYEPIPAPILLMDPSSNRSGAKKPTLGRMLVFNDLEDIRWVVPARGSEELCELHGVMDQPSFTRGASFDDVKLDHDGHFFNDQDGLPLFLRGGHGVNSAHPYLPDPMARNVGWWIEAFDPVGIPVEGARGIVPLYSSWNDRWPIAQAFRIRLVPAIHVSRPEIEGSWNDWTRTLEISLPPGWNALLNLSSAPDLDVSSPLGPLVMAEAHDLAMYAPKHADMKLLQVGDADAAFSNWQVVRKGLHPRISPPEQILLVHAVVKPLAPIRFNPDAQQCLGLEPRELGRSEVTLNPRVRVDKKTTQGVDLQADWDDWIDGPEVVGPPRKQAHPPDTITGRATGIPSSPDPVPFSLGRLVHHLPDTKYRKVSYRFKALSRFRDDYPPERPGQDFVADSVPVEIDLKNCNPPSDPLVRYLLPAFEWQTRADDFNFLGRPRSYTSRRRSLVRVRLHRGWWSSGYGELLGVVIYDGSETALTERQKLYVTRWGADPMRDLQPTNFGPDENDFDHYKSVQYFAAESHGNMPPAGVPPFPFKVVLFAPTYDEIEQDWFCDIRMNAPSYPFTFVRLRLVRFHPISIPRAFLSGPTERNGRSFFLIAP